MNCRILSWFVEQTELGGLVILICVYVCVEIFSGFFFGGGFFFSIRTMLNRDKPAQPFMG
jgi:hypothetical protein